MEKLIIFGTGEIAELAHYYFQTGNEYEPVAFTVDHGYLKESSFKGLPVVDFAKIEQAFPPSEHKMFIAVSYSQMNKLRSAKYFEAKRKGYALASYVSPEATIAGNVTIGDNCFIFEDNTIQPFVRIGNNVTLWSGNHIGHHSSIGDHCFLASHVVVSGGVKIEPFCFIGVNATLRDHIVIAPECVIGAGSLIMKDTQEKEVYIAEKTLPSRLRSDQLRGI